MIEEFDERGHPKVKPGFVRRYEDHTGRWYEDVPVAEYEEFSKDPLVILLREAIEEEITKDILARLGALRG